MRVLTYGFGVSGILGIVFAILSGVRWAINFPDPSQAIFGGLIGIGWAAMSFLFGFFYERLTEIRDRQKAMDLRWDSYIQGKKGEEELNSLKKKKK